MQLQFGQQSFDVATRAFTLLSLRPGDSLDAVQMGTADEPHVVEFDLTHAQPEDVSDRLARMQQFPGPVAVRTNSAATATAALRSGALAVHNLDGLGDPAYLRAIDEADASLILSCPTSTQNPVAFLSERVGWARARGVSANRLVVATSDTAHIAPLAAVATVMYRGDNNQGAHVVAVRNGARLLARTVQDNDVQATRRTIDTVSELLERRET